MQLCQRGDTRSLTRNLGLYVSEGLKRREGVLIIATAEHNEDLANELMRLGVDTEAAIRKERLICLDARETMARVIVAGKPNWLKFEAEIAAALRPFRRAEMAPTFRAYGEMVDLLWNARLLSAAVRLEHFWNKLLAQHSFSLYCTYTVDVFDRTFDPDAIGGVLCTHTHLLPFESSGDLESAVDLAMDDVLGSEADDLRRQLKTENPWAWVTMPHRENIILGLRKMLPRRAEQILERAREYYERSFQDVGLAPTRR